MSLHKLLAKPIASEEFKPLLRTIVASVCQVCEPEQVWLFGSVAGDTATTASDIDIAVILRDKKTVARDKKKIFRICGSVPWPIDFLVMDRQSFNRDRKAGGIAFWIWHEGKLMHGEKS